MQPFRRSRGDEGQQQNQQMAPSRPTISVEKASDCTPTCEFFGASAGQTGEQRLGYFRCSAADMLSLKSAMQQGFGFLKKQSLQHLQHAPSP
eukprot:CAMPEP_0173114666 /NCGR_PEP_ID=MMETSP1102-20130122/47829_1 /TAXON_ID=49646 /ORGANISM="Geminigera sp., Strain Caron Lab Isolate" /LENGTH=91 /DNA_ID=CAMNT_0014017131 /DNA_START=165 /DNA_END=436 /DNA_ORIENTATION=-